MRERDRERELSWGREKNEERTRLRSAISNVDDIARIAYKFEMETSQVIATCSNYKPLINNL